MEVCQFHEVLSSVMRMDPFVSGEKKANDQSAG